MNLIRTLARHMLPGVLGAVLALATSLTQAQTVTYFHNDPAGTPVLATDANGNVVWKENHRPYGQKLNNPAAAADNSVGYAGKPFDADTGLSYMGARYYDPLIGRFMGVDPQAVNPADGHSINRYAYANNNPYKYVDPDGRAAQFIVRMEWAAVTWAARELGAATLGSMIGIGIYDLTHADENLAPPPAAKPKEEAGSEDGQTQDQERDSKRFYDKEARQRAQDRSRDAEGDPSCEYCGVKTTDEPRKKNSSTTDHVKAWSKGGKTTDDNSANACLSCNSSKGSRELGTQWVPPNQR
jgi:RHS repeat-associated protein